MGKAGNTSQKRRLVYDATVQRGALFSVRAVVKLVRWNNEVYNTLLGIAHKQGGGSVCQVRCFRYVRSVVAQLIDYTGVANENRSVTFTFDYS